MRSLLVFRGNYTKLRDCLPLPLSVFLSTTMATIKIYYTYQNLQSSLFTIAIPITGNNPHLKTSFLIIFFYFQKITTLLNHNITLCNMSNPVVRTLPDIYYTSVRSEAEKKTPDRPKVILPGQVYLQLQWERQEMRRKPPHWHQP